MTEAGKKNYPSPFELEYEDETITTDNFYSLGQALDSVTRKDRPKAARFAWNFHGTDFGAGVWTNCLQSAIDEAMRESQAFEQRLAA